MSTYHSRCIMQLMLLFVISVPPSLYSQPLDSDTTASETKKRTFFDFLEEDNINEIELTFNQVTLNKVKRSNDFIPARFAYELKEDELVKWDIKIRARGKYRRTRCDFPPIKLEFSKKDLKAAGYKKKYDDFKLVTHCLNSREGKEVVLREYLTYKLYQHISPNSFRAHLVRIRYIDLENKTKSRRYGIILESEKELAKRLDLKKCEDCLNLPPERRNKREMLVQALFQYMIGNTDYSTTQLRNLVLLNPEQAIPVPYDFDFCGLVNAPYARPQPETGLKNTRQRKFLGDLPDREQIDEVIMHYQKVKKNVIEEINEARYLSSYSRNDVRRFVESFFKLLNTQKGIAEIFE